MNALKPVSFSKRQAPQARLSPEYVPGKRHERFWTAAERKVLLAGYQKHGRAWCAARLPGRSFQAIYLEAAKLGLTKKRRADMDPSARAALDATIKARWPELSGKGAVKAFAAEIGQPRWLVSQRARQLGLSIPRQSDREWSDAEKELLKHVPLHDPDKASEMFRARGFNRSATAIMVMSKRQGLSRRYRDTMSATAAAKVLGLEAKTVATYCVEGRLKAGRRGTKRLVQQGGDAWSITPADLRRFIIDNLAIIDIRKVDKFAFVDLLVNGADAARANP